MWSSIRKRSKFLDTVFLARGSVNRAHSLAARWENKRGTKVPTESVRCLSSPSYQLNDPSSLNFRPTSSTAALVNLLHIIHQAVGFERLHNVTFRFVALCASISQLLTFFCPDDDDDGFPVVLSRQSGAVITEIGPGYINTRGRRVKRNEAAAMRLVKDHTNIPVPSVFSAVFYKVGDEENGVISMEKVDDITLETAWGGYDEVAKAHMCREIWRIVEQL